MYIVVLLVVLVVRGPFGKFVAWHLTLQCVNKRLSNNTFLETIIQPLHDGWFTSEKVLGRHVQRMLETSRCLYTGVNFKQNVGRKSTLFTIII